LYSERLTKHICTRIFRNSSLKRSVRFAKNTYPAYPCGTNPKEVVPTDSSEARSSGVRILLLPNSAFPYLLGWVSSSPTPPTSGRGVASRPFLKRARLAMGRRFRQDISVLWNCDVAIRTGGLSLDLASSRNVRASRYRDSVIGTGFRDTLAELWETVLGQAEFVPLARVSGIKRDTDQSTARVWRFRIAYLAAKAMRGAVRPTTLLSSRSIHTSPNLLTKPCC
jgi:hypothetical protein